MAPIFSRIVPRGEAGHPRTFTILILMFASLLLLGGGGTRLIEAYERIADPAAIASASLVISGVPKEALPVTLLEVDDKTREAWGRGPRTPHGALAKLIELARSHGAAATLVDIDLSAETSSETADLQLASELSAYPADAPPLMLARKISLARVEGQGAMAAGTPPTPYDSLVAGKPNIFWITTLNDVSGDRQVKRIRLWQTVCTDQKGITYPSAALVAEALLNGNAQRRESLAAFAAATANRECEGTATLEDPVWPAVGSPAATLPYLVPDRADSRSLFRISHAGKETVVLRRISAGQLVEITGRGAAFTADVDRDPFADRVVLVGATHADSGDIYATPVGQMSGVMILANSIVQAHAIVATKPMPRALSNTLLILLFLTLAYVARKLQGAPSIILIGLVSLAVLMIVSRLFTFADGVAIIGVAIPGFALFKLFDSLVHIGMEMPEKGWKALLK